MCGVKIVSIKPNRRKSHECKMDYHCGAYRCGLVGLDEILVVSV